MKFQETASSASNLLEDLQALVAALAPLVVVLQDPGARRPQPVHVLGDRLDLRLERSLVFGVLIERRHRLQPNGGLVVVGSSQRLLQSLRRAAEGIEVEVRLESEALRAYFESTGVTGSQNRALEKKQAAY